MKIQERINALEGVTETYWDNRRNRLVIYYSSIVPRATIKIKVAGAIRDAGLQEAIEEITLISQEEDIL